MKLKNVKAGQRVELKVDTDRAKAGQRGVLKPSLHQGTDNCWVHFDEDVGGWGDYKADIPHGHGWTVPIKDLRLIKGVASMCVPSDEEITQVIKDAGVNKTTR